MKFTTKKELLQHLGSPKLFSKKVIVSKCVSYQEGTQNRSSAPDSKQIILSLIIYPKGIGFSDGNAIYIGFRFDEIKYYEIHKNSIGEQKIVIFSKLSRSVEFEVVKEQSSNLIYILRLYQIKFNRAANDPSRIKSDLIDLKNAFSQVDTELSMNIDLLDTSTFGNLTRLEINPKEIKWNNKTIKVSDSTGFSHGITINETHGITISREFDILIHINEIYPFRISFSKKAGISTLEEDEKAFEDIVNVLFNLISRKYVVDWFDKFSENIAVQYKEFHLTREGLIVIKSKQPPMMMYWDEIIVFPDIIRWKHSNFVFVKCDAYTDRRPLMLMKLLNWLSEDIDRIRKLLGTEIGLDNVDENEENHLDY